MRCTRWTTTRCSWWRASSFPTSGLGGACLRRVRCCDLRCRCQCHLNKQCVVSSIYVRSCARVRMRVGVLPQDKKFETVMVHGNLAAWVAESTTTPDVVGAINPFFTSFCLVGVCKSIIMRRESGNQPPAYSVRVDQSCVNGRITIIGRFVAC
jgi:hypothetical protein